MMEGRGATVVGVKLLAFQNDKEGKSGRNPDPDAKTAGENPERRARKRPPVGEVGEALRSVYQRTVNEDIPPEMLDLLGKLG